MTTDLGVKGYNTYYIGTPNGITGCNKISLAYITGIGKDNFPLLWDSVKNSSTIYNKLLDVFIIDCGTTGISFNTVFYLDSSGDAVGCTVFNSIQSSKLFNNLTASSIWLTIKIEISKMEINTDIVFSTSLDSVYNLTTRPESINYTNKQEVKDYYKETDNYLKYSTWIPDCLGDNNIGNITDSGFYGNTGITKFSPFKMSHNIPITPFGASLDKYWFTYLDKHPVIYGYDSSTKQYLVTSLAMLNRFGLPIVFYKGVLPECPQYCSGQYMFINSKKIYDIKSSEYIEFDIDYYSNPWDSEPKLIALSLLSESGKSIKVSMDYGKPVRKVGPWLIYEDNKNHRLYVSPYGAISTLKTENIFLLNDRIAISQHKGIRVDNIEDDFVTVFFCDQGIQLKSLDYLMDIHRSSEPVISPGIIIKIYGGLESMMEYYNKYIFTYSKGGGAILNPLIDGLRHRPLSEIEGSIPDLIGGLGGIVYYIKDYNLMML